MLNAKRVLSFVFPFLTTTKENGKITVVVFFNTLLKTKFEIARKSKTLLLFLLFMPFCTFSKHLKNAQINIETIRF